MTQQGIYVAPCEVRPNRDRVDNVEYKLWAIDFSVNNTIGCAVVKAKNPKEAEYLLKSEGAFNGTPYLYKITRIEEILNSPRSMIISEQILGIS